MSHANRGAFRDQLNFLRRQFLQDGDLPFTNVLTEEVIAQALPEFVTVRETRVRVLQPGFRTRSLVVVTTLLDPEQTTKEDLATLYRARWHNELDLRALKSSMQMGELRCKTPELVRKEVWAHILPVA